jgi:APA family basic amino acid/polyamine antiporter
MGASGELERVIGVRGLGLTGVNIIVGAGIFGLPAIAAASLGPAAILAYLSCALLVALVGLCLAESGSRVSAPGGLYAYAGAGFGPLAASFVGTLLWGANGMVSDSAVAVLLVNTLGEIVPAFKQPLLRAGFLVAVYTVVAGVNIRGVRRGAGLSQVMTVIKLAPLVLLIVVGLPQIHVANLRWNGMPDIGSVAQTSMVLFFAFMGIEGMLSASGEVRAPARTVPRSILLALGITTALYVGLQVVAQGVLGPALPSAVDAPLVVTAGYVMGEAGTRLLIAATLLSGIGFLTADILTMPRVLYALGRDRMLPPVLASVHPRFGTPWLAIATYSGLALLVALTGTFRFLAVLSASGTLVMYLICCLGLFRLRARDVRTEAAPFVAPGGAWVPLVATAVILVLLLSLRGIELLALLGVLGFAAILYLLRERMGARA